MADIYQIYLNNIDGQTFLLADGTTTVQVFIGQPPNPSARVVTVPIGTPPPWKVTRVRPRAVSPAYALDRAHFDVDAWIDALEQPFKDAPEEEPSDNSEKPPTTNPARDESP